MLLHRSLVFWCGFVVFGFLLWSWWDSMTVRTRWNGRVKGTTKVWFLNVVPGGLMLGGNDHIRLAPFTRGIVNFDRSKRRYSPEEADWLTNSGFWGSGFGPVRSGRYWQWSMPFSYLMIGFGFPWLGLSVWRARRIGKRRKEMAAV